jgi:hypothetical protein
MDTAGVIVASDQTQEWLLPWWWSHFHQHNPDCPVVFCDFGMSDQARSWCKKKGRLISIETSLLSENPDPNAFRAWEADWSSPRDLQTIRKIWFKKPLAMQASSFKRSVWIDLDCEIRGSLEPLFTLPLTSAKMAAASKETSVFFGPNNYKLEVPYYITGVVVFEKDSPLLNLWVSAIAEGSQRIRTEEDLLSIVIDQLKIPMTTLPLIFNWEIGKLGPNPNALIHHWEGEKGKELIKKRIALQDSQHKRPAP